MLLLSRARTEDQLRTENVNTHAARGRTPEERTQLTHHQGEPRHQTYFFISFITLPLKEIKKMGLVADRAEM